ncbi:MAG: hypothetical protein GY862_01500 [Gammaproteobacteria bacterium]|nr:hypothetical protein [Gammaproteobacteria bacterium]
MTIDHYKNISHAQLWGDVFEIAVKRGILHHLGARKLIFAGTPGLEDWRACRLKHVVNHVLQDMKATDDNVREQIEEYCRHLFVSGYALGWTVMREWLKQREPGKNEFKYKDQKTEIERLWVPFQLPARGLAKPETDEDKKARLENFRQIMKLPGPADWDWARKGKPPQADFLLQLRGKDSRRHLLCLEFSLNAPLTLKDFRSENAHLDELERYVRLIEKRGVFSRITAEVTSGDFSVSEKIVDYIHALSSPDKPLYKLFQGCSYLSEFAGLLAQRDPMPEPFQAQVIAVTAAGLEGLSATLGTENPDVKARLMKTCGEIYRGLSKSDGDLQPETDAIYRKIARSLPPDLGKSLRQGLGEVRPGQKLNLCLSEEVKDFINPKDKLPRERVLSWVAKDAAVDGFFRQPARRALEDALQAAELNGNTLTLRDIHSAAIQAAIQAAQPGKLTVLGLEGHPGIGKTTAMLRAMENMEAGYLFLYLSPRVLINSEVTEKLAQDKNLLAMTSNHQLITGAAGWYAGHGGANYPFEVPNPQGAVMYNEPNNFNIPRIGILFLNAEQAAQVRGDFSDSGYGKYGLDCRTDAIYQKRRYGVMRTLADACRAVLDDNPHLRKTVLTGSIQSYRELASGNTLDTLFKNMFHKARDLRELDLRFASRMPNIVVMADEITGDGAGAHVVHEFAVALNKYFLHPYRRARRPCPFRVILAIADASLGNDTMLRSYLEEDAALRRREQQIAVSAPEKILVSAGHEGQPFRLACTPVKLGAAGNATDILHIMADSFPARRLQVEYRISMTPVRLDKKEDGALQHPREALRDKVGEDSLRLAVTVLQRELADLPDGLQIILFAQDKPFLRELENTLFDVERQRELGIVRIDAARLQAREVAKLDSSVSAAKRRALMQPENRGKVKIWLMTSSGSRGVSFPEAVRIIVFVPRFAIEGGLMEIAQLIYRGRGGERGDLYPRKLIMLLQDFIFHEPGEQPDPLLQARRTLDLASMLVLLRAVILTRILGHADIRRQNLALVPVGKIMTDESVQTLSESLRGFLTEADICVRDKVLGRSNRGVTGEALQLAQAVFPKLKWTHRRKDRQHGNTLTDADWLRDISAKLARTHDFLLGDAVAAMLPEHLYFTGPLGLESWQAGDTEESISLENWDKACEQDVRKLYKLLWVIADSSEFPEKLRHTARDLKTVLDDHGRQIRCEYNAVKQMNTRNVWVSTPADYPRFLYSGEAERPALQHADAWLRALRNAAALYATPAAEHPVLAAYEAYPFFAMVTRDDPVNFARILNSRYFAATAEMNLLNVMLFT